MHLHRSHSLMFGDKRRKGERKVKRCRENRGRRWEKVSGTTHRTSGRCRDKKTSIMIRQIYFEKLEEIAFLNILHVLFLKIIHLLISKHRGCLCSHRPAGLKPDTIFQTLCSLHSHSLEMLLNFHSKLFLFPQTTNTFSLILALSDRRVANIRVPACQYAVFLNGFHLLLVSDSRQE